MQAAVIEQFGGPSVLHLKELPIPKAGAGEVVIRIHAAGLNRIDHYVREGGVVTPKFPHVLGADGAGTIEEVGEGVEGFSKGQRVIPMPGYSLNAADAAFRPLSAAPSYAILGLVEHGTYAQFVRVPARFVLHDTTGLSFEQVATLPLVLVTAVRAVRAVAGVVAGQSVLVHGGSSGSGNMIAQVAKAVGATVIVTVRNVAKAEAVRAATGADHVVPLAEFEARVAALTGGRGVDVVIDNLGGDVLARSVGCVKALGVLVTLGMVAGATSTIALMPFFLGQKQLRGTFMGDVEELQWGLEQVRLGRVKPVLDRTFPLRDAAAAHTRLLSGDAHGNIVLLPWA